MVRRWTGRLLLVCAVVWAVTVAGLAARDGHADPVLVGIAVVGLLGAGAVVAGDALHERRHGVVRSPRPPARR